MNQTYEDINYDTEWKSIEKARVIAQFNRLHKKKKNTPKKFNARTWYENIMWAVTDHDREGEYCLGCDAERKGNNAKTSNCWICSIDDSTINELKKSLIECKGLSNAFLVNLRERYGYFEKQNLSDCVSKPKAVSKVRRAVVLDAPSPKPDIVSDDIETFDEDRQSRNWDEWDSDDDTISTRVPAHQIGGACDTSSWDDSDTEIEDSNSDSLKVDEDQGGGEDQGEYQGEGEDGKEKDDTMETCQDRIQETNRRPRTEPAFRNVYYDRTASKEDKKRFDELCSGKHQISDENDERLISSHFYAIRDASEKGEFLKNVAKSQALHSERTQQFCNLVEAVENCYLPGESLRPHQILIAYLPHLCSRTTSPDSAMKQATGEGKTLAGLIRVLDLLANPSEITSVAAWITINTVLEQHLTVIVQVLVSCRIDDVKVLYIGRISDETKRILGKNMSRIEPISFKYPDINRVVKRHSKCILIGSIEKVRDSLKTLQGVGMIAKNTLIDIMSKRAHMLDQPQIVQKVKAKTNARLVSMLIDEYDFLQQDKFRDGFETFNDLVSNILINYEQSIQKIDHDPSFRVSLIKVSATLGASDINHPFDRILSQKALSVCTDPQPIHRNQIRVRNVPDSRDRDERNRYEMMAVLDAMTYLNDFDRAYVGVSNRTVAEMILRERNDIVAYSRGQKEYKSHVLNWGCHRAIDVLGRNAVICFSKYRDHQSFEHLIGRAGRGQDINPPKIFISEDTFKSHLHRCRSNGKTRSGEDKLPICNREFPDEPGYRF